MHNIGGRVGGGGEGIFRYNFLLRDFFSPKRRRGCGNILAPHWNPGIGAGTATNKFPGRIGTTRLRQLGGGSLPLLFFSTRKENLFGGQESLCHCAWNKEPFLMRGRCLSICVRNSWGFLRGRWFAVEDGGNKKDSLITLVLMCGNWVVWKQ